MLPAFYWHHRQRKPTSNLHTWSIVYTLILCPVHCKGGLQKVEMSISRVSQDHGPLNHTTLSPFKCVQKLQCHEKVSRYHIPIFIIGEVPRGEMKSSILTILVTFLHHLTNEWTLWMNYLPSHLCHRDGYKNLYCRVFIIYGRP